MNKKVLIIVGIIVIILLVGVWTYLLVFGTPESIDDVYADFGFTPGNDESIPVTPSTDGGSDEGPGSEPTVAVGDTALAQLTTRAVAGYRSLTTASNTVRYVELGTGHIYEIDLVSGQETVVSKTTVPQAHEAVLTPDGNTVVMRSRYHANSEVILGRMSSSSDELRISVVNELVSAPLEDFHIGKESELLYTLRNTTGLTAVSLDLDTLSQRELFRVPFHEAIVHWGDTPESVHYVQTKPSAELPGYLYRSNGTLTPLPVTGDGLLAVPGPTYIVYNTIQDGNYVTNQHHLNTGSSAPSPIMVFPEKCDFSDSSDNTLFCAATVTPSSGQLPDAWYQGTLRFSDALWSISLDEQSAELLVAISAETGREVDVTGLTNDASSNRLFFLNKHDNTLWTYAR